MSVLHKVRRALAVACAALTLTVGATAQTSGVSGGYESDIRGGSSTGDSSSGSSGQVGDENSVGKATGAVEKALCTGTTFNPINDPDWNNVYPITVAGFQMSNKGRKDPPMMGVSPICVCESYFFGMPMIGIGISYWEPLWVAEIEHRPGCSSTLGGTQLLTGYLHKHSEEADEASESSQTNIKHVHWYQYPIMSLLDYFKDFWCHTNSGFNLMWMTEIDPVWNDDEFGLLIAPEANLFANPLAQAACIVDAVSTNVWFPVDPLFWCAGSWGGVYPLSGNAGITNGLDQVNNLVMAKFIARDARMGLMQQTIGPEVVCASHPNPIWIKSQFRINQIGPIVRQGNAQTIGDIGMFQYPPVANYTGTGEYTANLVWQAQQCCAKIIP